MKRIGKVMTVLLFALLVGCSHGVTIKNMDDYVDTINLTGSSKPVFIGIRPYLGGIEGVKYHNAVVEKLNSYSRSFGKIQTDYEGKGPSSEELKPDFILRISPLVKYESSFWNLPISWPGFMLFTPAWHGYVYVARITTEVVVYDRSGNRIKEIPLETNYGIRHAELDRTFWSEGLGWISFSATVLLSGIYCGAQCDTDITNEVFFRVKDNYANYVTRHIMKALK